MAVKRRSSNKNPPILSHEFIIQNHADIVACVAMVFVVGLMSPVTSPIASLFIALHHNFTIPVEWSPGNVQDVTLYTSGLKDIPAIFFYLLIAIVMHQIIQEYLLDKVNRKLHLSKVKHAKFNESGQLLSFYVVSLFWAADIVYYENQLNIRSLWEGYPHANMSFMFKFYYIVQISYWLHIFPELYFQKVKREEMAAKIQYACLYLFFIGGAYVFNYTRLALWLLILQYFVDALFHACRLLSYAEKTEVASPLYKLHDILFVLVRLGSISLAVLTFWYGLALVPASWQVINISSGTFNTPLFRLNALLAVGCLQARLMYYFITFHLRRMRETSSMVSSVSGVSSKGRKSQQEKAKARKERLKKDKSNEDAAAGDDVNELPEVDQNTKRSMKKVN